jgi:hypothetical protein
MLFALSSIKTLQGEREREMQNIDNAGTCTFVQWRALGTADDNLSGI